VGLIPLLVPSIFQDIQKASEMPILLINLEIRSWELLPRLASNFDLPSFNLQIARITDMTHWDVAGL
jgi:hypothetical protein